MQDSLTPLPLVGSMALILDHQSTPYVAKPDTPDADWIFPSPGSCPRNVCGLAPGGSPIHCHGLRCHYQTPPPRTSSYLREAANFG